MNAKIEALECTQKHKELLQEVYKYFVNAIRIDRDFNPAGQFNPFKGRDTCGMFRINRSTYSRALRELVGMGLLCRNRSRNATYTLPDADADSEIADNGHIADTPANATPMSVSDIQGVTPKMETPADIISEVVKQVIGQVVPVLAKQFRDKLCKLSKRVDEIVVDEIAVVDAVQKLNQTVSKLTELVNDLTGQMSKVRHIPQDVSDIQEWIEEQKAEKAIDETEVERERKAGILYRLLDIASLGSGYEKDYDRIFTQEFGYNVNDTPVGEVDNVRKWIGDIIKGYWDGTA